jgi:hypothetical protein
MLSRHARIFSRAFVAQLRQFCDLASVARARITIKGFFAAAGRVEKYFNAVGFSLQQIAPTQLVFHSLFHLFPIKKPRRSGALTRKSQIESSGRGKIAKHVMQNAAALEVAQLVERIDAAKHWHIPSCAIRERDAGSHLR